MIKVVLKEYLKSRGIKVVWLSEKSNLSRTTIHNLMNQKSDGVKYETINSLCNTLNCNLEDIIQYIPDKNS